MKKVLLINGSPNEKGCTALALEEIASTLTKRGIESDIKQIGKKPVAGCIACYSCARTGRCAFNDSVNEMIESLDSYGALVVGSPVYYGSATGQICCLLDRLFFAGGRLMDGKVGACVVSCRRGGASAALDRLNKYFLMNNMPLAEGLQTMRVLADNIATLMISFSEAEKAGFRPPKREPRIFTNFIR